MTRYQALRAVQCGPITAGLIAGLNWLMSVPSGEIRFMHMTIEYEDKT